MSQNTESKRPAPGCGCTDCRCNPCQCAQACQCGDACQCQPAASTCGCKK